MKYVGLIPVSPTTANFVYPLTNTRYSNVPTNVMLPDSKLHVFVFAPSLNNIDLHCGLFKKLLIFTLIMLSIIGCKKDNIEFEENDSPLSFSANEITFDTVFATIGSITKTLKVFNNNKYDLSTDISLRGITEANFRMNIDGVSGNNQKNIIIPAKDSIFIFIEVTR